MSADKPDMTGAEDEKPRNRLLAGARMLFSLRADKSLARIGVMSLAFAAMFSAIGVRLVMMGAGADGRSDTGRTVSTETSGIRPDILDRNGEVLATDVRSVSVFAEPRNILDKDEATELLTAVLPDLNAK